MLAPTYTPAARFWRGLGYGLALGLPLWLPFWLLLKALASLFHLLFS